MKRIINIRTIGTILLCSSVDSSTIRTMTTILTPPPLVRRRKGAAEPDYCCLNIIRSSLPKVGVPLLQPDPPPGALPEPLPYQWWNPPLFNFHCQRANIFCFIGSL